MGVRWFRPRHQPLSLRTVQLRVTLVDPDLDDGASGAGMPAPDRFTLVPDVPDVCAAPPLAVRPIEDAEWTFRN